MDFMKVLDQAVREIKREVNIKVLKVPEIEQKVLDATSDEPWGPHGSALAEIAHGTKKFTECQLIMNVLWTRLADGGQNWRHVYKALAVIEYLVAHGTERVVDEIIQHTFQISSLSGFEYVEPNGKDVGLNVRKKSETIMALLNDKDKIKEVRKKAAANRDKYFGLSSTGITNKSSSASYGSSSFQHSDRYGSASAKNEVKIFKDSYRDRDGLGEDEFSKDGSDKSRRGAVTEDEGSNVKKGPAHSVRNDRDAVASNTSRASSKFNYSDGNCSPITSQSTGAPDGPEDDFDDFDPRGTSTIGAAASSVNQVDLFGDLMDATATVPPELSTTDINATTEVDLFADAAFVSALPHVEAGARSQTQGNINLFASQPLFSSASSSVIDFFATPEPVLQTEPKPPETEPISSHSVDPFAAVPLNGFDGSDVFGAFTSHTDQVSTEPTQNSAKGDSLNNPNQNSSSESRPPPKKDTFQIKSGIWADSLSRGLIDLNITAPKKTNLADIGIVGGLSDGLDEIEKGPPPTSVYMGRAMGTGSRLGKSGFTSSTGVVGGDDIFSTLGQQQQFGSFK